MTLPDIQLIAGEAVTVLRPSVSYDEHMEEVVGWDEEEVGNVVVAPASTSDVDGDARPHGTLARLRLGFPKSFTAPLRGCRVSVRGIEYAVIGDPQPNTAANCPTPWWYTAEVGDVDG